MMILLCNSVGELRCERTEASGRHGDLVARIHDASRRLRSRSCRYPAPQLHSRPVPRYQERGLLVRAGVVYHGANAMDFPVSVCRH